MIEGHIQALFVEMIQEKSGMDALNLQAGARGSKCNLDTSRHYIALGQHYYLLVELVDKEISSVLNSGFFPLTSGVVCLCCAITA